MANAFISILGTNKYQKSRYKLNGEEPSDVVTFVQEYLVYRFAKEWNDEDEIRIYLTDKARETNWFDNKKINNDEKLMRKLQQLKIKAKIKDISIPVGSSENEIWEIFLTIYNSFRDNEKVIIDVTHSFRYLPMLLVTLLSYAKIMKKIDIMGIYYGAFEALGDIDTVKNIPENDRIAPVFNLKSFSDLQTWTIAVNNFIENGITNDLEKLTKKEISDLYRYNIERNKQVIDNLGKYVRNINSIFKNIQFCRGDDIIKYDYEKVNNIYKNIKCELKDVTIKPLIPLLDKIDQKINEFSTNNVLNGFIAVDWCYEHNLIQQGITILQETILSLIAQAENKDYLDNKYRELISSALNIKCRGINEHEWDEDAKKSYKEVKELLENSILNKIYNEYGQLTELRNDINHCGFRNNKLKSDKIKENFKKIYNNIKNKINLGVKYDHS